MFAGTEGSRRKTKVVCGRYHDWSAALARTPAAINLAFRLGNQPI